MPRLSNDESNQAIGMLNAGMSATVVSRHFGCTRKTIMQHLRNRRLTAAATGGQYGIHPQTVRNRLRQNVWPIRAYWAYFGQILTPRHRTARQDWCRRHLHFPRTDWDLILFSDECQFNLSHAGRRERVYRRMRFADLLLTFQRSYKLSGPIYLRRLNSVTLAACATVSQHALHKMVDTWVTVTFHWIFSLFFVRWYIPKWI